MDRPYIFCHMGMSLDGKIMGNYMSTPEGRASSDVFYNIAFGDNPYYKHQGWISGRVTTDDNFTNYEVPELNVNSSPVESGDFVAEKSGLYYISIDPSGRLGWKSSTLKYRYTQAHVVEVLTERASNDYKNYLRRLGISYVIAGENELDSALAMSKIKELFGAETLMLGGGAALNWSFIQQGLCDEISVVVAATADGSTDTKTLFMAREGLSTVSPVGFKLIDAKVMDGDSVWLRYSVKN